MQHVCVLIAAPGSGAIDDAFVSEARTLCDADGNWRWLDRSQALEIGTHDRGRPKAELLTRMREAIADRPIDSAIVPVNHRRKHLLVADMDSTMIEQECIDELAYMVGEKERVSAITERAMRGEIAFEPSVRERVAILKGLPISIIDRVMDERITFTPGGRTLVATMHAHGAYTALVSGGFTLFTTRVAARLGFDTERANRLGVDGEALAGTVEEPILGQDAKSEFLKQFLRQRSLLPNEALAVGDGANDLAMIEAAGLGVAFRAKPAVAAAADAGLNHADLTGLLFLQGYTRAEFVE